MLTAERRLRLEVELFQQRLISVLAGIFRGQEFVAVENTIGSSEEAHGLTFFAQARAAGAETDFCLGQRNAGGRDEADQLENVDRRLILQRRARHGHETVDRNALGRGVEVGKDFEHFEAVEFTLTETDDTTAAHAHSRILHVGNCVETILEGVGRDDVRVMLRRGVDVVVVSGNTGFLQLMSLRAAQLAESHAYFHAEFGHATDAIEHAFKARISGSHALPRGTHAEAGAAVFLGAFGDFLNRLWRHQRFALHAGIIPGALRAIATVLRATTRLDGKKRAELHFVLFPMVQVNLARPADEVEKRRIVDGLELSERHWTFEMPRDSAAVQFRVPSMRSMQRFQHRDTA